MSREGMVKIRTMYLLRTIGGLLPFGALLRCKSLRLALVGAIET